jgi:hypothetical protein
MKQALLSALLAAALLAVPAAADLHRSTAWLQGTGTQGFGLAELDIDDEAGTVSVVVDFQGLSSPCTGGRLEGPSGATLCTLGVQGTGTAFGTAGVTPAQVVQLLQGGARVVIDTSAAPQGEIDGTLGAGGVTNFPYPFSPAQLVPPANGVAYGTGWVSISLLTGCGLSGQLRDLQGAITSIELWRDAWLGEAGQFVTAITAIGYPSPGLATFSHVLTSPTPELVRDLRDGMCFVIVRTTAFPEGELRGQLRAPTLGTAYCTGRPNSVSVWGARLALDGSPLATSNDLVLHASSLPAGKPVLPLVGFGTGHVFAPGGLGGMLCVAGAGIGRLNAHAGVSSAQGTYDVALDLEPFNVGGSVQTLQPGMRLNVQLWYRDVQGPTPGNFSSAVSVVFH